MYVYSGLRRSRRCALVVGERWLEWLVVSRGKARGEVLEAMLWPPLRVMGASCEPLGARGGPFGGRWGLQGASAERRIQIKGTSEELRR